jgi:chemotaxis protein MotB
MKTAILIISILSLTAVGCVKKSEFEALQKKLGHTEAELDTTQGEKRSVEQTLAQAEAQIKNLSGELGQTRDSLAAAEKNIAELQAEMAKVLRDKSALKASAAKLQQALAELEKRKQAAEQRVAEFRKLLAKFQKLIDAGKLKVEIKEGRMVLVLPTDILFASGSAKLSDEGIAAITEVAQILGTMYDKKFQVEGHTDDVPITSKRLKSNWALAAARALGVVEAMIVGGMPGESLSAASYGEFKPVVSNDTPENQALNRRIDIVMVPDLSTLPGFSDLTKAVEGK